MADDTLSQAEIDSLLLGENEAEGSAGERKGAKQQRIRAFDPANQRRVIRDRLHALDIINERFSRDFRVSLFNLLRRNADITIESVKIEPFRDYTRHLPIPSNFNLFSMKPLRGSALLVFPPSLVFTVVDNLFGGDGRFMTRLDGRDFTHTEQRIIARLRDLALTSYEKSWAGVHELEMVFQRTELQPRFVNVTTSPNEPVITTQLQVEIGDFLSNFSICIPFAMIEPIRDAMTNPALQKTDPSEQRARTERLAGRISRSHVPLSAEFATIQSTIGRLRQLKTGDVLPIELPNEVVARVDDVEVFHALFGRQNGHRALRVTRMIDHTMNDSTKDDSS